MPLHLLGKKSWNVYNKANIERVRTDEAKAVAREQAEDQRLQEIDSQRRIQILRGTHDESAEVPISNEDEARYGSELRPGRERKRRRIAGENDTDREMRYVREDRAMLPAKVEMQMTSRKSSDAPLMNHQGHIDLFPQKPQSVTQTKNTEVEREKARRKEEYEDQYTMRFSNAAGVGRAIEKQAWYERSATREERKEIDDMLSKDVWGNEDPRRKERERMKMAADDPLVAMRNGAAAVRQAEDERLKWREKKSQEIRELDEEEKRRDEKRRRHRHGHHSRRHKSDLPRSSKNDHIQPEKGRRDHHHHCRHRHSLRHHTERPKTSRTFE